MRKNTGNAESASAREKESPRMRNLKQTTRALCCALYCVALLAASHAPRAAAATIATTQQGMQQWRALNGKLVVIAASYRDTTSYKRSLTFYFEEKAGGEWLHVPVIESEADHTMTWFSVSNGESTVADAVVSTQGDATYLIVAEKKAAGIVATWYQFTAAGVDFPDGPAYMFKPAFHHAYAGSKGMSVEDVLKKEAASKAKK